MKKKFVLTEEESKRILSLHKKKIQEEKSKLEEQDIYDPGQTTGRVGAGAGAGAATGAGIGAVAGSIIPGAGTAVGAAVGAVIGAGVGALAGAFTVGGGYYEKIFAVLKFCSAHRKEIGKPVNSKETIREIADNIYSAVRGVGGTDLRMIENNIKKLKTIPDLCALNREYPSRFNERLLEALDGDIDGDDDWKDFVWIPISELEKNTKKIKSLPTDGGSTITTSKCPKIEKWFKDRGFEIITRKRYLELVNDSSYVVKYKFCPASKTNLYFARVTTGGGGTDSTGGTGGTGGGRGTRYGFNYQEALTALKSKCPGSGAGGQDTEEEKYAEDWRSIQKTETKPDTKVTPELVKQWAS
jgi:hypothetical protein